jgi:hypothetical protein
MRRPSEVDAVLGTGIPKHGPKRVATAHRHCRQDVRADLFRKPSPCRLRRPKSVDEDKTGARRFGNLGPEGYFTFNSVVQIDVVYRDGWGVDD